MVQSDMNQTSKHLKIFYERKIVKGIKKTKNFQKEESKKNQEINENTFLNLGKENQNMLEKHEENTIIELQKKEIKELNLNIKKIKYQMELNKSKEWEKFTKDEETSNSSPRIIIFFLDYYIFLKKKLNG